MICVSLPLYCLVLDSIHTEIALISIMVLGLFQYNVYRLNPEVLVDAYNIADPYHARYADMCKYSQGDD